MSGRAIILAGGLGTRLRPYTTVFPKPLMPVGDRPILDIVLRQLRAAGFDDVTIATGHLAELIEVFFGDGTRLGLDIDYFREEEPLGTVGALAHIPRLADGGPFIVMNGDVLSDIDYAGLVAEHEASGAIATIAATQRDVPISLGVLVSDEEDPNRLVDYVEKPTMHYFASIGVYCFSPAVLEHIEPDTRLDFPDLVLRLIERGEVVRSLPFEGFWLDIGRPEDYEQAQDDFERHRDRLLPGER